MPAVLRPVAACGLLAIALAGCGPAGDGTRRDVTVPAVSAETGPRAMRAVERYRAYAGGRVDRTIAGTEEFVAAFKEGRLRRARALYAPSRLGWESVEPVAEAFADIDSRVDAREADLGQGQRWTGWHRLEKVLWRTPGRAGREAEYGDLLLADLGTLRARLPSVEITVNSMANGARELLDEAASGKVTGEEETFSHTDLWDFKGNVDGAATVYRLLRPIVRERSPGLVTTLDTGFADLKALLARHARGDGFVSYTELSRHQVRELADALNAAAEPLSNLAAVTAGCPLPGPPGTAGGVVSASCGGRG